MGLGDLETTGIADFRYWCFDNELNHRIWHIFLCLETGEKQTIDLSMHKDIAYAYEVSWKCTLLAEGLSSLQVLQKMLKTSEFPIKLVGELDINPLNLKLTKVTKCIQDDPELISIINQRSG